MKILNHNIKIQKTRKPKKIIKKRGNEVMCLYEDHDANLENVEWVESEELIENPGINLNKCEENENEFFVTDIPVIDSLERWMINP